MKPNGHSSENILGRTTAFHSGLLFGLSQSTIQEFSGNGLSKRTTKETAELAESPAVARLLEQAAQGNPQATSQLYEILYADLYHRATVVSRGQPPGRTLHATAVVNEAYLRLIRASNTKWESRTHFLSVASKAMRDLLVDHARTNSRKKRGGGWKRISISEVPVHHEQDPVSCLDLDAGLRKLGEVDSRAVRLVELRFFGGMTLGEAAEFLKIPLRSAERLWAYAKAFLHRELS